MCNSFNILYIVLQEVVNLSRQDKSQHTAILLTDSELCVRIHPFGLLKLENSIGHMEETLKTQPTSILLLKYLLINHNRAVPQEELLKLFWPNNPDSKNALRVWMSRLRASFAHMDLNGQYGLILSSAGYYRLNPNYVVQIDCVRLDQIAAQLSMADQATPEGLKLCAEALELYQGTFLENTKDLPRLKERQEHYYDSFYYVVNTALDHMKALNNTSILPLLINRVKSFIPDHDPFYVRLSAFQRISQIQTNLAYFRSAEEAANFGENDVYIRLFGPLELENRYGQVVDPETLRYPSNSWLLLKYLLKNPGREVSQIELMEKFWPDELTSENEDGAFRVRLSRLRKALKPLHLDGRNGLVLFSSGFYSINSNYSIFTDEDTFIQLMAQISNIPIEDPKGLALCDDALDLFRDRFLACTQAHPWLDELQAHYNQEFCRLAYSTLERMKALNNYHTLSLLCSRAPTIVPEEAVLHLEIISLLTEKNLFKELIRYLSRLAQHKGEGYEWLEPIPLPSDASTYIKSETDIRIRLFGPVDLENQFGRVTEDSVPTFRWLLLKYLLANPNLLVMEEEFDQNVWSNSASSDSDIAHAQLRRRLREALSPLKLKNPGLVFYLTGFYGLNPKYNLITDSTILNTKMEQLQNTPADDPTGPKLCFDALSQFRAPFMAYTKESEWLTKCRTHYDQVYSSLVHSTLERVQILGIKQGLSPLWQSAVAYAPGNKDLHMKILTYMIERNLPTELIPYVCSLARHNSPETEWFHNL